MQEVNATQAEEIEKKMYPKREEFQWRPAPILCKRFDLIDPFMGKVLLLCFFLLLCCFNYLLVCFFVLNLLLLLMLNRIYISFCFSKQGLNCLLKDVFICLLLFSEFTTQVLHIFFEACS